MKGGTDFHFVTDGIEAALEQARAAAGGNDVRLGGGVATVREYVGPASSTRCTSRSRPSCSARGEHLFSGLDLPALGFAVTRREATELATHVVLARA